MNAPTFKTLTDESAAIDLMRRLNLARRDVIAVLVDGPGDGEFTVMSLRDAIEGEFTYRWEV